MTYHDPEVTYQGGFIKLFRSFKDWEWYTDSKTVHLFIHILLNANWKPKRWKGIEVQRGQFITSYDNLSFHTGMTKQEVRTRLKRLEKTGEINTRTNRQFTLITVCKYDTYQQVDDEVNTPSNTRATHDQHTTNTRLTPTKESKEYKEREEGESINQLSVRWKLPDNATAEQKEIELAVQVYKTYCDIYGKRAYEEILARDWIGKVRKIPADIPEKIPDVLRYAKKFNTFGYTRAANIDYLVTDWASFRADAERAYLNNNK